jgi:hypothetical protein
MEAQEASSHGGGNAEQAFCGAANAQRFLDLGWSMVRREILRLGEGPP